MVTPVLPFSYFDPSRLAYVDLTIPSIQVTISPNPQMIATQLLASAESPTQRGPQKPTLSDLATTPGTTAASLIPLALRKWFPLVQIAPVFGFFGLWAWDRRRRYLEAHPHIVVRRRARRGLRQARRDLHAAVQKGDAAKLIKSGVEAMRIGAAPHFPAEPRALVGTDVMALLTDEERRGKIGETVLRLFALADADQFGKHPPDGSSLLPSHTDIEVMLSRLEAML